MKPDPQLDAFIRSLATVTNRADRRKARRQLGRLSRERRTMLATVPALTTADILQRPCAECGQKMHLHPPPDYYPCPTVA